MRPSVPREEDFTSWLRSPAVTARVGLWLGIMFGLAFVTGVISHWAQTPAPWLPFPTSPSWGYRVTQGVHVIAGTAAVPLLLVKLWTVFPKLLSRPPREVGQLMLHGLERVSRPDWRTRRSGTPGTSTSGPPTTRSVGSRSGRSSSTWQ